MNANRDFEKKTFSRLGSWDYAPACNLIFAEVGFGVRYGASSLSEEPQEI